jgi:prepilin-type N-terminal cleavage/methylation domain-containing protein
MKYSSKNSKPASDSKRSEGFTLPEVMVAIIILAFVSSSVLVVIDRCVASAADLTMRMNAFEVAREKMETLLASNSVKEMVEYGDSYIYPQIQWQTTVETFYGPESDRMWIRAICSAEYIDADGETQKVELTHWLNYLTKQQMEKMRQAREEGEKLLEEQGQLLMTIEEAAEYAGVDVQTIQQWTANGMRTTINGYYIKYELEQFAATGGTGRVPQDQYDSMEFPDDQFQDTRLPDMQQPNEENF